jgi:hypothetical protein
VLGGTGPAHDLTNIAGLGNVAGVTGPHQGAVIPDGSVKPVGSVANLEEAGKLDLKHLLPPHH